VSKSFLLNRCHMIDRTLWKLIGNGEIEHRRVGRAVRINRASLEAYMRRPAEAPGGGSGRRYGLGRGSSAENGTKGQDVTVVAARNRRNEHAEEAPEGPEATIPKGPEQLPVGKLLLEVEPESVEWL
jgi:excisionase family DNA binding protein